MMASAASKGILKRGGGNKGGGNWRTGRTGRDSHEGMDDDERMGDLNSKTEYVDDGGSCSNSVNTDDYHHYGIAEPLCSCINDSLNPRTETV